MRLSKENYNSTILMLKRYDYNKEKDNEDYRIIERVKLLLEPKSRYIFEEEFRKKRNKWDIAYELCISERSYQRLRKELIYKTFQEIKNIKANNKEIWKEIKGTNGIYQVSNYGNIRSFKYRKWKILKPYLMKNGYLGTSIEIKGKRKWFKIHQLVAKEFISNPNNYTQINHKDENKTNNSVSNLEWCDSKYNMNYGNVKRKISIANGKKVAQYYNQKLIGVFDSARDAARKNNISLSVITRHCRGETKRVHKITWRYLDKNGSI